jgi:hypothetical protein
MLLLESIDWGATSAMSGDIQKLLLKEGSRGGLLVDWGLLMRGGWGEMAGTELRGGRKISWIGRVGFTRKLLPRLLAWLLRHSVEVI